MTPIALSGIPDSLQVIAISSTEWRISDPSRKEQYGLALLGFVERIGSFFEVTALGRPRERSRFSSLEQAVCYLA